MFDYAEGDDIIKFVDVTIGGGSIKDDGNPIEPTTDRSGSMRVSTKKLIWE